MRPPSRFAAPRSQAPVLTLVLAGLSGLALLATPVAAVDTCQELKWEDLQPPYVGPGHRGSLLEPAAVAQLGLSASGINLAAWLPLGDFPGSNTRGSDIWGYVAPSGREYAIIGFDLGTGFVEITDPINPEIVGYIASPGTLWKEITTIDQVAYIVADDIGEGMQVVDLSAIDSGVVTLVDTITDNGLATVHTIRGNEASEWIYLNGSNLGGGGLLPYNASNPLDPTPGPSIWTTSYVHDAVITTYTAGPYAGREIAFICGGFNGLYIVDVTNKAAMSTLSHLMYPNVTYCHYGWLSDDKKHFFIGDEIDELAGAVTTSTTYVIDVQNLSLPLFVTSFTNGNTAIDHNPVGIGSYFLTANYRSGLRIFDWSNLGAVQEVAWFDTYPADDEPEFNGAWGVHRMPSGVVLVSDMERGLFVFDVSPTVQVDQPSTPPTTTRLLPLEPNPFRAQTNVTFTLAKADRVKIDLVDVLGRRLLQLQDREYAVGRHVAPLDLSQGAREIPAGTYWVVLRTSDGEQRQRAVVVR